MGARATLIEKVFGAVIATGFVLWVLPLVQTSFFGLVIVFLTSSVIAFSLGKLLSGDSDWKILIPAALAVFATLLLFTISPVALP